MLKPGMLKISVKLIRTHIMTALPSFSTRRGLLSLIDFYHTSRSGGTIFRPTPGRAFFGRLPLQKKTNLTGPHVPKQGKMCLNTMVFQRSIRSVEWKRAVKDIQISRLHWSKIDLGDLANIATHVYAVPETT